MGAFFLQERSTRVVARKASQKLDLSARCEKLKGS